MGDLQGHDFRGNQWTGGGGGPDVERRDVRDVMGLHLMDNAPWAQENVLRAIQAAGIPKNRDVVVERWTPNTQLAAYRPDWQGGQIAINASAEHWYSTDLAKAQGMLRAENIASSSRPEAPLVHELGHALHHDAVRGNPDWTYHGREYTAPSTLGDSRIREMISRAVSDYAGWSNDPREFVAEVFAGLHEGKTYPSEVMKLYKEFHGPRR